MTGRLIPYELVFHTPFRLAHGTRTGTRALYLALTENGVTGYGEATFPPYLPETIQESTRALEAVLPGLAMPQSLEEIGITAGQHPLSPFTRNLLVNALTDLYLRLHRLPAQLLYNGPARQTPRLTFTLTKGDQNLPSKQSIAARFSMLKLKLDGNNDLDFAEQTVRQFGLPFCADANQGWENMPTEETARVLQGLKNLGCELIEQPFHKNNHRRHADLAALNILPVFADEGIQGPGDFALYGHCYDGINIKLLKCGGIDKALELAGAAHHSGKKIIVGCMSESSCGCAAALALKPLAHYLDLDGPWLVSNDPFTGLTVGNGGLQARGPFGFGVEPATAI